MYEMTEGLELDFQLLLITPDWKHHPPSLSVQEMPAGQVVLCMSVFLVSRYPLCIMRLNPLESGLPDCMPTQL